LRRENVVLYLSLVGAGLAPDQMYCHPAAKRRDLCHSVFDSAYSENAKILFPIGLSIWLKDARYQTNAAELC